MVLGKVLDIIGTVIIVVMLEITLDIDLRDVLVRSINFCKILMEIDFMFRLQYIIGLAEIRLPGLGIKEKIQ